MTAKLSCKSGQTKLPFAPLCKFNISFAEAAKLALGFSVARLMLPNNRLKYVPPKEHRLIYPAR
jgi:hypothetical protein